MTDVRKQNPDPDPLSRSHSSERVSRPSATLVWHLASREAGLPSIEAQTLYLDTYIGSWCVTSQFAVSAKRPIPVLLCNAALLNARCSSSSCNLNASSQYGPGLITLWRRISATEGISQLWRLEGPLPPFRVDSKGLPWPPNPFFSPPPLPLCRVQLTIPLSQ